MTNEEKAVRKQKHRESLLEAAANAQTAFWEALSELEDELGVEVDGNKDLDNQTVESLLEAKEDDEDDEGEVIYDHDGEEVKPEIG